jgi:hypothetical protein
MTAVIFEVEPAQGQEGTFLDAAADLRPLQDQFEGFILIHRFKGLTNRGKSLSVIF